MFTVYIVVTGLAAAANTYAATVDILRSPWVLANMTKYGVPHSLLFPLGLAKAAGALGLLAGIALPFLGIAAAVGLAVFFLGALITVVRSQWYSDIHYPATYLLLAAGSLVLRLASP